MSKRSDQWSPNCKSPTAHHNPVAKGATKHTLTWSLHQTKSRAHCQNIFQNVCELTKRAVRELITNSVNDSLKNSAHDLCLAHTTHSMEKRK